MLKHICEKINKKMKINLRYEEIEVDNGYYTKDGLYICGFYEKPTIKIHYKNKILIKCEGNILFYSYDNKYQEIIANKIINLKFIKKNYIILPQLKI